MAPTFCLRRVFWTPAMMAPPRPNWRVVLAVLASASTGWYAGGAAAMAGELGFDVFAGAVRDVGLRLDPPSLAR